MEASIARPVFQINNSGKEIIFLFVFFMDLFVILYLAWAYINIPHVAYLLKPILALSLLPSDI